MERNEIENLKYRFRLTLERGRMFFGKEVYDNYVIKILEHFGYSTEDEIIKEIFGELKHL